MFYCAYRISSKSRKINDGRIEFKKIFFLVSRIQLMRWLKEEGKTGGGEGVKKNQMEAIHKNNLFDFILQVK